MATKFSEFITKTTPADVAYVVGFNGLENVKIDPALLGGGGGGLSGTSYVYVAADGTDVDNASQLLSAYNVAKTLSPTSINRVTVIAAPGLYNFEAVKFIMDTQYIDLVSLDGNQSIVFNSANSSGTIRITANDVFVKGINVQNKVFEIATSLNLLRVENCKGLGTRSFNGGITSGTFTDCTSGSRGFSDTASGKFVRCLSTGVYAFGDLSASGIFIDCEATGTYSFGGNASASGTFLRCRATSYSFGTDTGSASGVFTDCSAGFDSFGEKNASGTFIRCTAAGTSFGVSGTLTGKLYYCRVTSGLFATPTGSGLLALCIDGNNDIINR